MSYEDINTDLAETRHMMATNNALALFINEILPEGEEREWAEAKRDEILADISPDVLWATLEDGSYVMDKDYLGGFLLIIQDKVRNCQTVQEQRLAVDRFGRYLQTHHPAAKILQGEQGVEAQQAFLQGAMAMVDTNMDAELIERDLDSLQQ